jgi:DNA-binding protein H-NS
MYDKILEKLGLKYEDLTSEERTVLDSWVKRLESKQLTLQSIKEYLQAMKSAVEDKLTKTSLNSKQDLFLKARLRNYLLLDAFITSPEKARQAIENMIEGIAPKKSSV